MLTGPATILGGLSIIADVAFYCDKNGMAFVGPAA
jgi:hypothetical protein